MVHRGQDDGGRRKEKEIPVLNVTILMLLSWGKNTSGFPDGMAAGKIRFRKAPKAAGRNDGIALLLLFPSSLQLHYNGSGLNDLNAEHTNQLR